MNPTHKALRSPPSVAGTAAGRASVRAPRFVSSVKPGQSGTVSNRAFIGAWMARRAKLAAAAKLRAAR